MQALAVLRLRGDRLDVFLRPDDGLAEELSVLGLANLGEGCWSGPSALLEPACSLLDRIGTLWGLYNPDGARTFGERLFAECPDELAPEIYQALRTTLVRSPVAKVHVAALDAAWRARGRCA